MFPLKICQKSTLLKLKFVKNGKWDECPLFIKLPSSLRNWSSNWASIGASITGSSLDLGHGLDQGIEVGPSIMASSSSLRSGHRAWVSILALEPYLRSCPRALPSIEASILSLIPDFDSSLDRGLDIWGSI